VAIKPRPAFDGEIVAFDEDGRPSFQQLQHRAASSAAAVLPRSCADRASNSPMS
jgi:ATP-dependent DNA ligase